MLSQSIAVSASDPYVVGKFPPLTPGLMTMRDLFRPALLGAIIIVPRIIVYTQVSSARTVLAAVAL